MVPGKKLRASLLNQGLDEMASGLSSFNMLMVRNLIRTLQNYRHIRWQISFSVGKREKLCKRNSKPNLTYVEVGTRRQNLEKGLELLLIALQTSLQMFCGSQKLTTYYGSSRNTLRMLHFCSCYKALVHSHLK